jgi:N6-adenosine-specific RNA methylase IME4
MDNALISVMTAEEATLCRDKIKAGISDVRVLVLDFQEREGWKALGYDSWRECVIAEFGQSQSQVYRLLDAAKVDAAISPMGEISLPERQARELMPVLRSEGEAAVVEIWRGLQEQYGDRVTAAKVKDAVQRKLKQEVARDHEPPSVTIIAPPIGQYNTIVIDPPWPMQKIEREERPNQGLALDYPIMSLEEIEALPIPTLMAPDGCHVYLWVTQKYLPAGLDLFRAWGVTYQCLLTWVKPTGMTPYSWMYNTEHVIYGHVGNLKLQRLGLKLSFEAPVVRHSQKPDAFYERVLAASPEPRLEMFSRIARPGFTAWGNEA